MQTFTDWMALWDRKFPVATGEAPEICATAKKWVAAAVLATGCVTLVLIIQQIQDLLPLLS